MAARQLRSADVAGASALLLLLCLTSLLAAPAAAQCRVRIAKRRSESFWPAPWTSTPPPLSIAELELWAGDAPFGSVRVPPAVITLTPSSNWDVAAFPLSSLQDNSTTTFWASGPNDPDPTLTITWPCAYRVQRVVLINRRLSSGTYSRCGQACVNRLSAFALYEDTNVLGQPFTPGDFFNNIMWWSPEHVPGTTYPPNTLFALPETGMPRINVFLQTQGAGGTCFVWASPVPNAPRPLYFNLNEMQFWTRRYIDGPVDTQVPRDQLYASMTGWFPRYGVEQCFDNVTQGTPCASTNSSDPGPRVVVAGPCGNIIGDGPSYYTTQLRVFNRPSSSPGCVGCAGRITSFVWTAASTRYGLNVAPLAFTLPPWTAPSSINFDHDF